jgi:hypothetical protein
MKTRDRRPDHIVNLRPESNGQKKMVNMLTIYQRPLIVLFGISLSLLMPVLIAVLIGHTLLASPQNGGSIFSINLLPHGVNSASLKRNIATFNTIVGELSIIGVIVASALTSALLQFRFNDEKEFGRLDDRLNAVPVAILWFVVFNLFFYQSYGVEYAHQRAIVGIYAGG